MEFVERVSLDADKKCLEVSQTNSEHDIKKGPKKKTTSGTSMDFPACSPGSSNTSLHWIYHMENHIMSYHIGFVPYGMAYVPFSSVPIIALQSIVAQTSHVKKKY